jgi:hypothetical protein
VFDDFDQLYTQILYTDLLAIEGSEDTDAGVAEEVEDSDISKYDFEFPKAEEELNKLANDLKNPDNGTTVLIQYIYEIDYKIIVAIQKKTADVFDHEAEVKNEIQKISNTFRRDPGCMKKIKEDYKKVMEEKINKGPTSCKPRLEGVKYLNYLMIKKKLMIMFKNNRKSKITILLLKFWSQAVLR